MAEEPSEGFAERIKELLEQSEQRMMAMQDRIANQLVAHQKAIADQVEQMWKAQQTSTADMLDQLQQRSASFADQWQAQQKAIGDQIEQRWEARRKAVADMLERQWNTQRKALRMWKINFAGCSEEVNRTSVAPGNPRHERIPVQRGILRRRHPQRPVSAEHRPLVKHDNRAVVHRRRHSHRNRQQLPHGGDGGRPQQRLVGVLGGFSRCLTR
jgi:hypothetical protein